MIRGAEMKTARQITAFVVLAILAAPSLAAEDDGKAFGQFQKILADINGRSFETMQKAIDKTELSSHIYRSRIIEDNVKQVFSSNFWQFIESSFMQKLPAEGSNVEAKLVDFAFENGKGRAAIRYALPKYEYAFQVFDLRHDSRGRLKVIDWFDTRVGQMFSAEVGESLTIMMPTKNATRKLISLKGPSDLQLFQVTEIYKASRDMQPPRFFEIYDEFNDELRREPFIAKYAALMALLMKDMDRFVRTLEIFVEVFSNDPNFALVMSEYYAAIDDYDQSYALLSRFHSSFSITEGALPAKLSALALALGKLEEAEKFAVEATVNEPSLELGWWSLLRARARSQYHSGAIEALTYLEDNFGHRLDEAKLRRDKFRGFARLVESEEYKEWRAGRD
jgi:hypothetical protein